MQNSLILNSADLGQQGISESDSPFQGVPAWFNLATNALNGVNQLEALSLSIQFETFVCAGINDGDTANDRGAGSRLWSNAYTKLAWTLWDWNGSGTFDSHFNFDPKRQSGQLVAGVHPTTGAWESSVPGDELDTSLPIANTEANRSTWKS